MSPSRPIRPEDLRLKVEIKLRESEDGKSLRSLKI